MYSMRIISQFIATICLIIIHRDLVDKDNDPLNTYVKLNLLPDKTEAGYRETKIVKDKDPKFDQE